ncbi:hypothetical protein AAE478_005070 [Parahypoxylon ruwenzoriense]
MGATACLQVGAILVLSRFTDARPTGQYELGFMDIPSLRGLGITANTTTETHPPHTRPTTDASSSSCKPFIMPELPEECHQKSGHLACHGYSLYCKYPTDWGFAYDPIGECWTFYRGTFTGEAPVNGPDHVTEKERILAQVTAALVILWMDANFLIKLVMLFVYRRIFIGRVFNILNWVLIGLSVVWFIYAVLSRLLYCGTNLKADVEGGWKVWRLQLDLKPKIAVVIVFILGGFAFAAGLNNTII